MTVSHQCQSCAMPIENGAYCSHCTDDNGNLQSFEERVRRMSQFMKHQTPSISEQTAIDQAIAYMGKMPAWKDHPDIKRRLG